MGESHDLTLVGVCSHREMLPAMEFNNKRMVTPNAKWRRKSFEQLLAAMGHV